MKRKKKKEKGKGKEKENGKRKRKTLEVKGEKKNHRSRRDILEKRRLGDNTSMRKIHDRIEAQNTRVTYPVNHADHKAPITYIPAAS